MSSKIISGCGLLLASLLSSGSAQDYDAVILHGRVIDPESKLDAVCNLGINDGVIRGRSPLKTWAGAR